MPVRRGFFYYYLIDPVTDFTSLIDQSVTHTKRFNFEHFHDSIFTFNQNFQEFGEKQFHTSFLLRIEGIG